MLRIISLLNQKNHYLEKFYSLNENEILNFSAGNFDQLEDFYQTREKILEMVKYLDQELDKAQNLVTNQVTTEQRRELREALAVKDEYVSRILSQDLEILACIESAKSNIIRELQDLRKTKRAVSGYKSNLKNHQLDEEA
ncbi:MAG: flagellar protein FliT [Bdellovibrionaceae bacterium]|nr:flagellar protein FliT [Pseudobdellovibrionaceae bacterium]